MKQQSGKRWFALLIACALFSGGQARADHPAAVREFRGMFVTTAFNLDWPSTAAVNDVTKQKDEIQAIVDRAVALNLNVIVLQVRAFSDRIHRTTTVKDPEPWAISLTGTEGQDPEPTAPPAPAKPYDPLKEWIERCHAKGLELHIWVNPFRGRKGGVGDTFEGWDGKDPIKQWWHDPTKTLFRKHLDDVLEELLCYDRSTSSSSVTGPGGEGDGGGIDGIVIDHYAPPDPPGFGGEAKIADGKRKHISNFVEDLHNLVKKQHYGIKFGITPRAVPRKGYPPATNDTIDMYEDLYADVQTWLEKGHYHYMAPELYGEVNKTDQFFPYVLQWWTSHKTKTGHDVEPILLTALNPDDVSTSEIKKEIEFARNAQYGASGHIFYSWRKMKDADGDTIKSDNYDLDRPALVPRCAEAEGKEPVAPKIVSSAPTTDVQWDLGTGSGFVWLWEVWQHNKATDKWQMFVFPTLTKTLHVSTDIDEVTIHAIDRYNREGPSSTTNPNP